MKSKSIVERSIKDSGLVRDSLSPGERKTFNKIKRSLMKTFVNPNYAVKILIDIAAMEYIRYTRQFQRVVTTDMSRIARSIKDTLAELDLTPRSRKSVEVSKTLSQIFQTIAEESDKQPEEVEEDDNA